MNGIVSRIGKKRLVLSLSIGSLLMTVGLAIFAFQMIPASSADNDELDGEQPAPAKGAVTRGADTNASRAVSSSYIPPNGTQFTVGTVPTGGVIRIDDPAIGSSGFCMDYSDSAPGVGHVFTTAAGSAMTTYNPNLTQSVRDNISAVLRAWNDPAYSGLAQSTLENEILRAVWSFSNGNSVSGTAAAIRTNVLNGTYQPQPVVWMAPSTSGTQPMVTLPGIDPYQAACQSSNYYADYFGSASYGNSDGTLLWTPNWQEVNSSNSSASSDPIRITNGELRIGDPFNEDTNPHIQRQVDLSGVSGAEFSFDFSTATTVDYNDSVEVRVRSNGSAWQVIETFTGMRAGGSRTIDLSDHLYADTRIDFRVNDNYGASNEFFAVDNVQICIASSTYLLGDKVFYDQNQDGIQDSGENGVSQINVALYDNATCAGSSIATDTTDSNGLYEFTNLSAGDYCVAFTNLPADWQISPANQTNDDDDSDGVSSGANAAQIQSIALNSNDTSNDLGIYAAGEVGDMVWCEQNDNTTYQSGTDLPLDNINVDLYLDANCDGNADGSAISNTDSNTSGFYSFTGLELAQSGNTCYIAVADGADTDLGTCNVPATSLTQSATLNPSNRTDDTLDYAFSEPAPTNLTLGDKVFYDTDQDGKQDAGEGGVGQIDVALYQNSSCSGQPFKTTLTNGSGFYEFTNLSSGSYCIEFDNIPAGWQLSPASQTNNANDSDAVKTGNNSAQITSINLSADDDTQDMGIFASGQVGDTVWCEQNGNTAYDNGVDLPLAQVTVSLYVDAGCDGSADGSAIDSKPTNGTGYYAFAGLQIPQTGDICYITQVDAQDANLNTCNIPVTPLEQTATLNTVFSSTSDNDHSFTTDEPAAIGDFVWYDTDADGIQELGEPGIGNVTLNLYSDTDGTCDPNSDTLMQTTTTNADGSYLFKGLAPGDYCVDVTDVNAKLAGMSHSLGVQSVTDPSPVVTLAAGESNLDQDFGYYTPLNNPNNALIGDTIWYDDGDGVMENGEPGIAGVTVNVRDTNGTLIASDVTDDNGRYLIQLPAGTYTIEVATATLPAGLMQSFDPDSTSDDKTAVTLAADETRLDADFGYKEVANTLGSIGNQIWLDDGDGTFQSGSEAGIPAVCVNLVNDLNGNGIFETGEPVIATDYTDADGVYRFDNLPADDYVVHVCDTSNILRDYLVVAGPNLGNDNNSQGGDYAVTLGAGQSDISADFGYISNNSTDIGVIGNQLWFETDRDGLYEDGELGMPGVTVELQDNNGSFIRETTTAGSGTYAFTGLPQGDYKVVVTGKYGVLDTIAPTLLGASQGSDDNNQAQPYMIALPQAGINTTADFGYTNANLSLGDLVWTDDNQNGLQDEGTEFSLADIPLELYCDSNGNGQLDANDQLRAQTMTSGTGFYRFNNLGPCTYFVLIPLSAVFGPGAIPDLLNGPTIPGSGAADAPNDSNGIPNPTFGVVSGPIVLIGDEPAENGLHNPTVDMGFNTPPDTTSVSLGASSVQNSNPFGPVFILIAALAALMMLTALIVRRMD